MIVKTRLGARQVVIRNEQQLRQYFKAIDKNLDEFDDQLQDTLAELIDEYLGR